MHIKFLGIHNSKLPDHSDIISTPHLPGAIVVIAAVTFCVGWGVEEVVVMGTGVVGTAVLGVTVLALLVEPALLPVNKPGNCKTKT